MWNLNVILSRDILSLVLNISLLVNIGHEHCYPVTQQNIHMSAIRFLWWWWFKCLRLMAVLQKGKLKKHLVRDKDKTFPGT